MGGIGFAKNCQEEVIYKVCVFGYVNKFQV